MRLRLHAGLWLSLAFSMTAHAQVAPDVAPPPTTAVPAVVLPLVNPADELKGRALVDALRGGGYVFYMRHALQIPPASEKCEGPSLTPVGEGQARQVGAAIRELKIPVGKIRSSEPCRNRDTAKLLGLGPYEISTDLNPVGAPEGTNIGGARQRQLAELPPPGTNTLLISHVHGSRKKSEWMHLEIAEIIVYRPDGKGAATPVARVRLEGWGELRKAMGDSK